MKKILMGLFVFSFLLVGFQVHSALAQENLSIILESDPQASNGTTTINLGDAITFTGFPNNLTGQNGIDYTTSFNFDSIFDDVCNNKDQNGSNFWFQKCTPTKAGTGSFYIQITQNGHVYNSNVIRVIVKSNTPATTITLESNPEVGSNGYATINLGDAITFTGFPNNLTGQNGIDYTTSFNFDSIFDDVCNNKDQNGSNFWFQKCTPTKAGTGSFYIQITQNGHVYKSNVIRVKVVLDIPATLDTSCSNGAVYSSTTGKKCFEKDEVKDTGCIAGYNYSSMTGKPCALGLYKKDNTDVLNPTTNSIKRTLKRGIKGDDVKILQLFLNLAADGSFGPQTQQKVMEWQVANGLTPDGAFGNMSRQKAGL